MPNTVKVVEIDQVRENLIALLKSADDLPVVEAYGSFADYLIENGVTVSDTNVGKWIPVSERLPELNTKVLCCGIKGGRFIAELTTWGIEKHLTWDKRDGKGCPTVTHWMPLPEPPKEEP